MPNATRLLFNGIVDEMLTRITNSIGDLGLGGVEERAEDPAVLDKVRQYYGYAYLIPLAESRDRMDATMGGTDDLHHTFTVSVMMYYWRPDSPLGTELRSTRDLGFDLIDLFLGDNAQVATGHVRSYELEQGYFTMVDMPIYFVSVKFTIRSLEVGIGVD